MNTIWMMASADASSSRRSLAVSSYTATSSVANCGPPSTSTTPKEVKQKAKASAAEDAMAGSSTGRVTCQKVRTRPAPSIAALSSSCGATLLQKAETMRTKMA